MKAIRVSDCVLGAAALLISAPLGAATVSIDPGTDIQSVVDQNPSGTTYLLKSGVHRLQSITPKDGDTFTGETGTVLSGAVVLTSFSREGSLFYAPHQTQRNPPSVGMCDSDHPLCLNTEDLYFDGVALTRVGSKADVTSGTWYFDYGAQNIYFAGDPSGHTVETSITQYAFSGPAVNVTIQNLTVEKYASPAQKGAVGGSQAAPAGWVVQNNEIRWNHGLGVHAGDGGKVLNNYIHHNGQMGINRVRLF